MPEPDRLQGGELNAALTSALVGINNEQLGRGPCSAYSFHHDNVVVTIMSEVMTKAERTLLSVGHGGVVSETRHLYQQAMRDDFVAAVERLTGCDVTAFISGNSLDPDIAVEVFILDGLPAGHT